MKITFGDQCQLHDDTLKRKINTKQGNWYFPVNYIHSPRSEIVAVDKFSFNTSYIMTVTLADLNSNRSWAIASYARRKRCYSVIYCRVSVPVLQPTRLNRCRAFLRLMETAPFIFITSGTAIKSLADLGVTARPVTRYLHSNFHL